VLTRVGRADIGETCDVETGGRTGEAIGVAPELSTSEATKGLMLEVESRVGTGVAIRVVTCLD
jgi:hypothetical protein